MKGSRRAAFSARAIQKKIFLLIVTCIYMTGLPSVLGQPSATYVVGGKVFDADKLQPEIEKVLSEVGVPGLSFAVIENNKIVFSKGFGFKSMKDMLKVDNETIFEAASLSKSFLLLAAYRLVDEGKLELDKPLCQYLKHDRLEHDPRYKLITARMVLSHSSGIENWQANHNSDALEILSDPGKEYVYSGEGYNYLDKVIAQIVGKETKQYMDEMVYSPLMLKRTYSCFSEDGTMPVNYASGHDEFGDVKEKWKNKEPVPSSGINTTAGDYARLIVALFNNRNISAKSVKAMLTPMVQIADNDPDLFYGAGFEMLLTGKDTLIFQGGSNDGYKGHLCYSVVNKRGIVLLTNGDRGKRLIQKIAEISSGMDLSRYFHGDVFMQYPSIPCELFNLYRKENADAMFSRLAAIVNERGSSIDKEALNEIAYTFRIKEQEIAKKLLFENIKLFPEEPNAYWILGKIFYGQKNYQLAYDNLVKAKNLNFNNQHWINHDIKKLEEIMAESPK